MSLSSSSSSSASLSSSSVRPTLLIDHVLILLVQLLCLIIFLICKTNPPHECVQTLPLESDGDSDDGSSGDHVLLLIINHFSRHRHRKAREASQNLDEVFVLLLSQTPQ